MEDIVPLANGKKNSEGHLIGSLEIPMAVGIIGGSTNTNPVVKTNLKILEIKTAQQLAQITTAVGLAQNAGALRALADEGIQKGHMGLHARNLAVMAGAPVELVDKVVAELKKSGVIRLDKAQEILQKLTH